MSSDRSPNERRRVIRVVPPEQDGERLDRIVAAAADISRREARLWIRTGRVRVGGTVTRILSREIRAGRKVEIDPPHPVEGASGPDGAGGAQARAEVPALEITFLDRHVVAVNKPPGLLTERDRHGAPSVEGLLPQLLRSRGEREPIWLVHRLDAPTSGVLVVARTVRAAEALGRAFREGTARKDYLALCAGTLSSRAEVNAPIGRVRGTRHGVRRDGKTAATELIPLGAAGGCTLVHARPRTGRTHQIRVHLAHLGHPLLGDGLYGGPRYTEANPPQAIGRAMLHAARLRLPHPKGGAPLELDAPPAPDFAALAEALGLGDALRRFGS